MRQKNCSAATFYCYFWIKQILEVKKHQDTIKAWSIET